MANQLLAIVLAVIAFCLLSVTCYAQKGSKASPSSKCSVTQNNSEGWKRYYLEGPNGDAICVYLPREPERFPGGKLRGGKNFTPTIDVYLVAENEETYAVVFVYDLTDHTEQMPDDQKGEMFFGSWRSIVETVRQGLEKRLSTPVDVRYSEQTKVTVNGHEGRTQDFSVGPYVGQARMLFVEKKAYMLMGLWPLAKAEKRGASFFDSFEMRIKH